MIIGSQTRLFAQYNPDNPDEPSLYYKVTLGCTPADKGYQSGDGKYLEGTEVWISTSGANENYTFQYWTLNGEIYSRNKSFTYTMEQKDVSFIAHYKFSPVNPDDPSVVFKRSIHLESSPSGVASFNISSSDKFDVGSSQYVCAYYNSSYDFLGWYEDTVLVNTSSNFYFTVPDKETTLTARFKYNPDNPTDPSNFYSTSVAANIQSNDTTRGTVSAEGLVNGRAVLGSAITLKASAMDDYSFGGWSDGTNIVSTDSEYSFVVTREVNLTAIFLKSPHMLTYLVDGVVYSSSVLELGESITPLAPPEKDGYTFSGWSDIPQTMPDTDVEINGTFTLTSVRISATSISLEGGKSQRLRVYAGTSSTEVVSAVEWTSDDETIAKVSSLGIVRGVRQGTTKVYGTTTDGSGLRVECTVEVTSTCESALLPDVGFEFNYNAVDYNEEQQYIPNNELANLAGYNLQLTSNIPSFRDNDHLRITSECEGYIDKWEKESAESGDYFYRQGTDNMTIVCKAAPALNTGNVSDFISNRGIDYNWMLRIGDNNSVYLHTLTAYSSDRSLQIDSDDAQIFAVRVNGQDNYILIENLSTGKSLKVNEVNWGGQGTAMKFFYNNWYEYFTGSFYWAYLSFEYLSDDDLVDVVDYNEGNTSVLLGDVDDNGKVDIRDLALLIKYLNDNQSVSINARNSDADKSGSVSADDVDVIKNIILGRK